MADSIRKLSRDQAVAALNSPAITVNGITLQAVGSRYHPVAEEKLATTAPAFVTADEERAEQENKSRPFINRTYLALHVDVVVNKADGVEDLVDELTMLIQHRLAANVFSAVRWVAYRGRSITPDEDNLDILHAEVRFEVFYMARENAVDTPA